jgi:hypothetical protein
LIAFTDRDCEDPGAKPRSVDQRRQILKDSAADVLKDFPPLVDIEVKPGGYGINHSFVPPEQAFP